MVRLDVVSALVWVPVAVLFAVTGCARTVPPKTPSAALYRDLERLVGIAETTGWQIDRIELESMEKDALLSVCHTEAHVRAELLAWIDQRIAALGGDAETVWRARGKNMRKVNELMTETRIRMVLVRAMDQATRDCPFWIEPSPAFAGRQISDNRWSLTFGGGGKGIIVNQSGETDLRFGGAGRVLVGRQVGSRLGLYFGAESGGTASFPRDDAGERGNVVFGLDLVAPLVARYTLVNGYLELEAGPLGSINEVDRDLVPGMHLGFAFGGRASRQRWFFPGAVFGVSFERTFPTADQGDPITSIKLGFRVAIDVDL